MPDGKVSVEGGAVATDRSGGLCPAAGPVAAAVGRRRKNCRIPLGMETCVSVRQIVIRCSGGVRGERKDPDPRFSTQRSPNSERAKLKATGPLAT
jgi:hypothetical protein